MTQKQTPLAIMFADISGSTRLYDRLGDAVARQLVAQCLGLMADVVHKYAGIVIKTIGDEIMCTFETAGSCVDCAVELQEAVAEDLPTMNPSTPADMTIRIGLHHGMAIEEKGDVFGDAVNMAARMAGLAKGGQILTTEQTVKLLDAATRTSTRHLDRLSVKGKAEVINIYEVLWQTEDVTRMATGLLDTETIKARLHLLHRGGEVTIAASRSTPFVMGRGKNVDMVVEDSLTSREHARIEMRRGKFILIDQSTNGTYVQTPDGPAYLRRDELPLSGKGRFSLGRDLREEPDEVVNYWCD